MVEQLSLMFDAPPDGAAVSYEQTQARVEEFRQIPWLEPEWDEATRNILQGGREVQRTGIGAFTSETICLISLLRRWLGFQFRLRKGFRKVRYIHLIEQSLVPSSSLVYGLRSRRRHSRLGAKDPANVAATCESREAPAEWPDARKSLRWLQVVCES
jgi:hypothetical protein